MKNARRNLLGAVCILILTAAAALAQETTTPRAPDVPYVPTRPSVVDAMLKVAKVTKSDVVYDLGSGDGRIVIAAAKQYGATGLGVDIDPQRVREARQNADKEGVADKVKFVEGDLFKMDLSKATVITMYLLPAVNMKLRPKLLALKPGTRIVSHAFDLGDWEPDETLTVEGSTIYFWTVPDKKTVMKKKQKN
jgi:SAM-dependent methyltransferase